MTAEQIIDIYDRNPDMLLSTLSRISGWSVSELHTLLLGA